MNYTHKDIIATIFLKKGMLVKGFKDHTPVCDPVRQIKSFNDNGMDKIILYDLSDDPAEHDQNLQVLKKIIQIAEIPVYEGGNINSFDDVRKLIYAGCEMAALNLSKESNRILAREVCERFGKDRIAGCYRTAEKLDGEWDKLAPWLSMRILLDADTDDPAAGTDAGDPTDPADSAGPSDKADFAAAGNPIPVIAFVQDASGDAMVSKLSLPSVAAVSGDGVNALVEKGKEAVGGARASLEAAGIDMEEKKKAAFSWSDFKKGPDGLLPVVVQEESTDQVLMVAYMNEEAYNLTVETGKMTYYSRSRKSLWIKGETSGHFQYVRSLHGDCDMDTLLARVVQIGAACHTGSHSCFFNQVTAPRMNARRTASAGDVLREDYRTIIDRKENPKEGSYTNYLFDKGIDKMLKKLGEENTEIVIAAKNPGENEIIYEIADYLYHLEVVMAEKGVDWDDITRELVRRQKKESQG